MASKPESRQRTIIVLMVVLAGFLLPEKAVEVIRALTGMAI